MTSSPQVAPSPPGHLIDRATHLVLRAPKRLRSTRPDLVSLADENLMQLVCDGDARAFAVIYDRHANAAFSLAYRMCGRRLLAEDVVQEALLSVWRSSARYDPTLGSVRSWILGAVHNRAIDVFRREAVRTSHNASDQEATERMPGPGRIDIEIERRDAAWHVRSALQALPPKQRQVIELAYFGGFTHRQIAEMLTLPAGTVKGQMRLGLAKLRIALDDPPTADLSGITT